MTENTEPRFGEVNYLPELGVEGNKWFPEKPVRYRVGRSRKENGVYRYSDGIRPDYVWLWLGAGVHTEPTTDNLGMRMDPDTAEAIATMLMYEAKLVRDNNNRQETE